MPRIRPPKPADDGSVTIDLSKPPPDTKPPQGPPDYASRKASAEVKPEQTVQTVQTPAPTVRTGQTPPAADAYPEEPNDLERQVQSLKAAEKAARDRAAAAEQARAAEQQRAQQAITEQRGEIERTQYDSVVNALAARQNEVAVLRQSYRDALARNDVVAAEEINDKIIDAKIEMKTLEGGKQDFERNFQKQPDKQQRPAPQQPPAQPQQRPATVDATNVENVLATMPGLTNEERDWVRAHPDAITQEARMRVTWEDSQRLGLRRNSPEYFKFFNERMGYEQPPEAEYEDIDMAENNAPPSDNWSRPPLPDTTPAYSAPPSRSSPGSSSRQTANANQVTLNPQQREAAKISGVDEYTYAKNVQRLRELKKQGYYQENG